ncbi:hypothetical protein BG004_001204 [Podila humilis]|nr:hypothetical protein BG004_001204 [Podila humilis]
MNADNAARWSLAAEATQSTGKRPVIFTGTEETPTVSSPLVTKHGVTAATAISAGVGAGAGARAVAPPAVVIPPAEQSEAVFKKTHSIQSPELQAKYKFKLTKTQPPLYYKPANELSSTPEVK